MVRRPTKGDIVACAGVGAMIGSICLGLGLSIFGAIETGRMNDAGWAVVIIPLSLLIAMFTAWPMGCIIGILTLRLLGWGYPQAGLAGAGTGLAVAWLFGFASFASGDLIMTAIFLAAGAASGLFAWRVV